jgi:hypothetical protein
LRLITEKSGFTVVEFMLATVIGVTAVAILSLLLIQGVKLFRHYQMSAEANSQARSCMDTIQRLLSNGLANTVTILDSPYFAAPTTASPPGSEIKFTSGKDGLTQYDIYWSDQPSNCVHIKSTPPGGLGSTDTVLATGVSGINFTWSSGNDAIVTVSLQMMVAFDAQTTAAGVAANPITINLPNRSVRLLAQ